MSVAEVRPPEPGTPGPGESPGPTWEVALLFPCRGQWTESDYLSLPDNRRVELSQGDVEVLPMPSEVHPLIAAFVYDTLSAFVRSRGLGLVLFAGIPIRLWPGKMRQPDVVFLATEHYERRGSKFWEGADLAVEIVSPDDPDRDWVDKRWEYAAAGIAEYWIVDPDVPKVSVLVLSGDEYHVQAEFGPGQAAASVLLPEFTLSVDEMLQAAAR